MRLFAFLLAVRPAPRLVTAVTLAAAGPRVTRAENTRVSELRAVAWLSGAALLALAGNAWCANDLDTPAARSSVNKDGSDTFNTEWLGHDDLQGRVTYQGDNTVPDLLQVDYEYPSRDTKPAVHLTWYHGVSGPDLSGQTTYRGYCLRLIIHDETGHAIVDHLGHRTGSECNNRCRAGHRLDHDQPERLGPRDRRQQRHGTAEECRLLVIADLTDVVDVG